jgi:hypothetical protein
MPFFDDKLIFSDGQTPSSSAASTYELDFGVATPGLDVGTPMEVVVVVETTATSGMTSATIEIQDSAAGSSYSTIASYAAIGYASLTAGATFKLRLPSYHKRFVQLYYTIVGTGDAKLTAYLQPVM